MTKNLVIVESPAKARTINKYLGKDYEVTASMGHIRDLPARTLGIDIERGFEPVYEIIRGKKKAVQELRKKAKKAEHVYLAPDLDREGEAIAWHLLEALELPPEKAFRVTFNEITKSAIQKAFETPTKISMSKVNAQQARRLLDRLVGYKLSPLLWDKVTRGLSAGRVQSVAVKLVAEREKEIRAFKSEEYWRITAQVARQDSDKKSPETFKAELARLDGKKAKLTNQAETDQVLEQMKDCPWVVSAMNHKKRLDKAPPPFITSTLQQQASVKLRFSAKKTMMIAQQLYEGVDLGSEGSTGLITYMRTDSVRVSQDSIGVVRTLIGRDFGDAYLPTKPNVFKSKSKGAQEAHEAIRPTDPERSPEKIKGKLDRDQYNLYELIWKRFVASQMTPALYALTTAEIEVGPTVFQSKGKVLRTEGHTILSGHSVKKDDQILPAFEEQEELIAKSVEPSQHFTQPPPRYSEATLVKMLEKLGIGRPSTYAPIISTIQSRGYVRIKERKFRATDLGLLITDLLVEHFPDILDTRFTSDMEEKLDRIEESDGDWRNLLFEFYLMFSECLQSAKREMVDIKRNPEVSELECEKCGKAMIFRWNRNGRFLGCSGFPDCRETKPVDIDGNPIENEKMDVDCELCGESMSLKVGRNGRFLACSAYPDCKSTVSIADDGTILFPEKTELLCEKCESPLILKPGRRGKFYSCSTYPECDFTRPLGSEGQSKLADKETGEKCDKCESPMWIKYGRRGAFLACSAYPKCRNPKPLPDHLRPEPEKTDEICEDCGKEMVIREGRRGRFLACTGYPKCKHTRQLKETQS